MLLNMPLLNAGWPPGAREKWLPGRKNALALGR
jgi:hypothetical protein